MTDWSITLKKGLTNFLQTAIGSGLVMQLLLQMPQDTVIIGGVTVGVITAMWRILTDAHKHRDK